MEPQTPILKISHNVMNVAEVDIREAIGQAGLILYKSAMDTLCTSHWAVEPVHHPVNPG